jgi:YesN/AraC family two-component response regulator
VSQVIKYITENFHQNITLSSVAKEFYISPFYLSKLFKQTTNFTFVEYLNSIRIKNSKELLKNTNYKIIDIAEKVGFSNNTHFTRVFKIIVGMSPMKFRKLHTEK